ncbi:MAG: pantetheine-phosphate adenylyltransferase [Bacteroidaceae bacterium]|nr:pantetheine-phosphate adenylyltransferase [Bacteroidaceae bacterium]
MKHSKENRLALFAGTFDPFTIGHHDIVKRALAMFDEVVVAIGSNSAKQAMSSLDERLLAIRSLYANEPRVSVVAYEGLTVDYAKGIGACCLLRGVRSMKDFDYERDLAEVNRRISGMETVLLVSNPLYASISSSVVRELISYGKDVSDFIPK